MKHSVESITKAIRGDGWTDNSKRRLVNNKGRDRGFYNLRRSEPELMDVTVAMGAVLLQRGIMSPLMI